MAKCGTCGRFLNSADAVGCCNCKVIHHRGCVAISEGTRVPSNWVCSNCKIKPPRQGNISSVPVTPAQSRVLVSTRDTADTIACGSDNEVTPTNKSAELSELVAEMRFLRNEITAMRSELKDYRTEIAGFRSSLENLNVRVDSTDERVTLLEKKLVETSTSNHSYESIIQDLRSQINERDQDMLHDDVVLSGVLEARGGECHPPGQGCGREAGCHLG
ncbi:unnamed protein product [Parnassius apollo]|uniref:(apollo) hypothetical protein n=1 Tax=Parnassius apollo TaxID=110799 RepID=A0A8S3YB43_PARAO|nr:unnamed protein product [Parnassius apollo]